MTLRGIAKQDLTDYPLLDLSSMIFSPSLFFFGYHNQCWNLSTLYVAIIDSLLQSLLSRPGLRGKKLRNTPSIPSPERLCKTDVLYEIYNFMSCMCPFVDVYMYTHCRVCNEVHGTNSSAGRSSRWSMTAPKLMEKESLACQRITGHVPKRRIHAPLM